MPENYSDEKLLKTGQKMKFSMKKFFGKSDEIRS